jgi:ligand-binding sensor domain-containing protein
MTIALRIFSFVFLLLFACNEKKKETSEISQPKKTEAKGYIIPKDSVQLPTTIAIGQPEKIPAGKFKTAPAYTNIHIAGDPKVTMVNEISLKKIIPGTDSFKPPKVITAIIKPEVAKQPKPVPALAMRMKDEGTYNIQYLDVDEGLSSSYVSTILQDKFGNFWFGTRSGGVNKYDGRSFTAYTNKEGLSNNNIRSMYEDRSGNLWFGTDFGVSKYDGRSFTNFSGKEGLSDYNVWSILEDRSGNFWFGTAGDGVSKFDGKTFARYTSKQGVSDNVIAMHQDRSGNIWFGTYADGIFKYDGKSFTNYTEKEGLCNNTILSILEDSFGNLWFASNGAGVSKYDGRSFSNYTAKEGLSNNNVVTMMEDKSGNIWFGTSGGGVNKYDGNRIETIEKGKKNPLHQQTDLKKENGKFVKSFTHYTIKEGLSRNYTMSVYEDRSGNIWIATDGSGINKYVPGSFKHFTDKEGLSNLGILTINEDRSGNMLFGTYGGGVNKYDGKTFTYYTDKEGLNSNNVWVIRQDKAGDLWFATTSGDGISKFDGKNFTHYGSKEGLTSTDVWLILEDRSGNLWFGTYDGGVSKFDGKTFTNYTEAQGLSNYPIKSMLEDRSGNIWFATDGDGAYKFNGKTFTRYDINEGLSSNNIGPMLEDRSGNIWIATFGGGINKFDGKTFTLYTEKEGLSSNSIASIAEDRSGNIWCGTEKGLSCFVAGKKAPDNINPLVIVFHKEDGLRGENFLQNSVFLDSKNQMWWGTGNGLVMLDLNNFKINEKVPEIQLDNIYLQENFVDFRNLKANAKDTLVSEDLEKIKFNAVETFYNYPKGLELPYNLNHLTFNFSAIDWLAPYKIKYQFKLKGLDQEWNQLTADNMADYRNIPYGGYTFQVRSIGGGNKWSKTLEYPFVIHPPWWRTWWAHIIYGAMAIIVLILVVWLNSRRLISRAKVLKIKIEEATEEIREQKQTVEEKNKHIEEKQKEILDSIRYARRIQTSLLPTEKYIERAIKRLDKNN